LYFTKMTDYSAKDDENHVDAPAVPFNYFLL